MKIILFVIFSGIALFSQAQITTQETSDGSITISPRGIEGKTSGNDSTANMGFKY